MPAVRGSDSKSKTRRRKRDLDQIHADLHSEKHLARYISSKAAEDLPGLGEWYCVECAKWFESENNLRHHQSSKTHKKRKRALREQPYTQKDAEAAIGLTTDNGTTERMAVDDSALQPEVEPAATNTNPSDAVQENDDEEYDAFFTAYTAS